MSETKNNELLENKKLNGTFQFYNKLQRMQSLDSHKEFRELLSAGLQFVFNHQSGFEMFSVMIEQHIDLTGDDELFFDLQDLSHEIQSYLQKGNKQ